MCQKVTWAQVTATFNSLFPVEVNKHTSHPLMLQQFLENKIKPSKFQGGESLVITVKGINYIQTGVQYAAFGSIWFMNSGCLRKKMLLTIKPML